MNDANIKNIENVFIDVARRFCTLIGWRESIGHVYALLYIRKDCLSLDDIAQEANLSKSNIWGVVQYLVKLGAVNKVWRAEERKDYFVAERDFDLILYRGILPLLNSKVNFLNGYLENAGKEFENIKKDNNNDESFAYYENLFSDVIAQKDKMETFLKILEGFK